MSLWVDPWKQVETRGSRKDKEHRLRARGTGSRREATLPGAVRSQEEPTHRVQGPQGPGG
ncbi:Hypothetical protein RMHFA_04218 [Roseomonas mucosa]|nr:Hypothetical protein RMHFA_04218 [Roseomonas mucosa]